MRGLAKCFGRIRVHDLREREARAVDAAVSLERIDGRKRNEHLRRHLAALHVRKEIGAAGDQHRVALAREDARRLSHRLRRAILKPRQAHHAALTFSFVRSWPLTALPSPPSHGGGTMTGSGYGTAGNEVGPTRRLACSFQLERAQYLVERDRKLVDAHADRVVDRVRDSRHHRQKRSLPHFLRAERAVRIRILDEHGIHFRHVERSEALVFEERRNLVDERARASAAGGETPVLP